MSQKAHDTGHRPGKIRLLRLKWKLLRLKIHRVMHRHWWSRHLVSIIVCLISLALIIGGISAIWVASLKIPDLSAFQTRVVSQSTKIYDRTGQILLYEINGDIKRTVVPSASISPYLKNATVAIEDNNFYKNIGIEPLSILRSIFADIFTGSYGQGGSTITQQVIKNSLLTTDKTISRKLKEWVLAIKLTQNMSKDDILTTYLNETSYGGNIFGVEEAAKVFFGKDASDLTLAEAAYIAALPQAPTYYSPYGSNTAALDDRAHLVLKQMLLYKLITQDEYNQAIAEKVTFLAKDTTNIRAPHFSLYVENYLEQKYGEDTVLSGGLKVITTLDYTMQQKMESTIANFGPTLEKNFDASNTAMVAIDPKTGDILALVGSRDYYDSSIDGQFDIATAYRQPGSTFKPFVYATAFEKGYTPDTILWDVPTEFSTACTVDGKPKDPTASSSVCYHPVEYDGTFEGPMTIRYALPQSRNLPAIEALYLAGIPDSIKTAQEMGITSLTDPSRYGLTLVLGGGEVSLLDLTSAYSVFANDGLRNPYRSVLEVDDANGNVLEKADPNPDASAQQVLPTQIARQINDILSDTSVREPGITQITNPMARPVAVKTGTTNDYRDVWTMGYTPNLVVGAWAGNSDDSPMQDAISTLIITPEWGAFMLQALQGLPIENFKAPNPESPDLKPVLRGIWKGGISYKIDTISGKVATQYTPVEDQKEIVFNNVHSILQWVNKDDPQGPIPADPTVDPQYAYWEYGVQNWFQTWLKSNPSFTESSSTPIIPAATDDVHVPANFPIVSIVAPDPNTPVDPNQKITINVTNTGKYPMQKSELYINDQYILSNSTNPSVITFFPKDIPGIQATNTLQVVVYDTVQDQGDATSTFEVNLPSDTTGN
jgi:penicillin-binding protein 1C